jgi:hypothetical protein
VALRVVPAAVSFESFQQRKAMLKLTTRISFASEKCLPLTGFAAASAAAAAAAAADEEDDADILQACRVFPCLAAPSVAPGSYCVINIFITRA